MSLWFVAAHGRGTSLQASVYGPYNTVAAFNAANPGFAGETFTLVGNKSGYPNKLAAQAEANAYNKSSVTQRVTQAGGNVAPNVPNPLDIFKGLNLANWLLRIGEIALGIVLMGVGLAKLTGVDNQVAKFAKSAGTAAMFA
jgi:hypothetical protein